MSLSRLKSKLEKLEETAGAGDKKLIVVYSDLERANRVRYLLGKRPNEWAAERIEELLEIARQRKEAAERGASL
jgi:hypothetical protein